jgi:hypothetical protein
LLLIGLATGAICLRGGSDRCPAHPRLAASHRFRPPPTR